MDWQKHLREKTEQLKNEPSPSERLGAAEQAAFKISRKHGRAWKKVYQQARERHGIEESIEIADKAIEEPQAERAEAAAARAEDGHGKLPPHPLAGLVPPLKRGPR